MQVRFRRVAVVAHQSQRLADDHRLTGANLNAALLHMHQCVFDSFHDSFQCSVVNWRKGSSDALDLTCSWQEIDKWCAEQESNPQPSGP